MSSKAPKVRYVRCPKCRNLLLEPSDVQVYQCGICETVLQSKTWKLAQENNSTESPEGTITQPNASEPVLKNSSPNLSAESISVSKETSHCSDDANISMSGNSSHGTGNATLETIENGRSASAVLKPERTEHPEIAEISEKVEEVLAPDLNGSETTSCSPDKLDEHVASSNASVVLEDLGSSNVRSSSSRMAYEGSISSSDEGYEIQTPDNYHLRSRRTFRSRELSESKLTEKMDEEIPTMLVQKILERLSSSKIQEFPSSNGMDAYREDTSGVSEDMYPVGNWVEMEKDIAIRALSLDDHSKESPSLKLKDLQHSRMELLRQVDELRYQLIGSHEKRRDRDRLVGGINANIRQPLFGIHESGHEFELSQKIHGPPDYHIPQVPLSRQTNHCCLHCHGASQSVCCNNGLSRACCHICCHPSNASGFPCHMVSNPPLCYHNTQKQDIKVERSHCKLKDVGTKRHCRPVLGGAHFLVCYYCLKLLQLPEDLQLSSTRCNKLRCGACSRTLMISLLRRTHIVPYDSVLKEHLQSEVESSNEIAIHGGEDRTRRAQVSYSEKYGPSFPRGYSTDGRPPLHRRVNSTDSMQDRSRKQLPLHHLMGYDSASEILYKPWYVDEE